MPVELSLFGRERSSILALFARPLPARFVDQYLVILGSRFLLVKIRSMVRILVSQKMGRSL
jgi:hypothetical protein